MRNLLVACVLLCHCFYSYADDNTEHLDFVIAIASYNNEQWVQGNLDSVYQQVIPENCTLEVYYIDDASEDQTGVLVDAYFASHNVPNTWHVIHNTERKKQLQNYYELIHSLDPKKIVLICDGDDRLANKNVLNTLAPVYRMSINEKRIWLTWGNYYRSIPDGCSSYCRDIPQDIVKNNAFRQYPFVTSHLRTFYAGLYQQIHQEDLMYNGKFFPVCTDVATMLAMLELASDGHFYFIKKILYVYNNDNPIRCVNPNNPDRLLYPIIEKMVRSQVPYQPLNTLW